MDSYVDNYLGEWDNECGWHLSIAKAGKKTLLVSLLFNGEPLARPWCDKSPSTDMIGKYNAADGVVVDLWEKGKGFSLHLDFEPEFELDEKNRDALTVALSRYVGDDFLDQYYSLFGPLRHYVKATT